MKITFVLRFLLFSAVLFSIIACNKNNDEPIDSDLQDIESLENYQNLIGDGVSLVFFHATWCSICRNQRPAVESLMKDNDLSHVFFGEVNYEQAQDIVTFSNVDGFPTMIFYKDGVEQDRLTGGGHSSAKIKDILEEL